jgi:hypothetical protein
VSLFFFTNLLFRPQLFGQYVLSLESQINNTPTGDNVKQTKSPEEGNGEQSTPRAPRHACPSCPSSYLRIGDLVRHQGEKHGLPRFLCPVDRCPRGIEGEGFGRSHHLVAHLTSKKHGMEKTEALFLARQFNRPKSKARQAQLHGGMDGRERK